MSKLYVVLFCGGISNRTNYERYENDIKLCLLRLSSLSNFSLKNTHILWAGGSKEFYIADNKKVSIPGAKHQLLELAAELLTAISAEDEFIFIATNHGGRLDNEESTLWCWNKEYITATNFAKSLEKLPARKQIYIFGQCYSGGFIQALGGSTSIVMTACRSDQVSYASADLRYDEFILRICEGLEKRINTWKDVFEYAKENDTRTENPQYWDQGRWGETDIISYLIRREDKS